MAKQTFSGCLSSCLDGIVFKVREDWKIVNKTIYLAVGLNREGKNSVDNNQNYYLYNGKELQNEIGLYDYGHCQYDLLIGRFTTIDSLAKDYYNLTPYNYAENNSILMIDPDGWVVTLQKRLIRHFLL